MTGTAQTAVALDCHRQTRGGPSSLTAPGSEKVLEAGKGWMPASGKGGCPSYLGEVAGCQRAAVRMDRRKQSQEAFRCLSFPDRGNGSTLPVAPARSLESESHAVPGAFSGQEVACRSPPPHHPSSQTPGEDPTPFGQTPCTWPPTGSWLLRPPRGMLQAPGRHRCLAAPCQLLLIAATAAAAALQSAQGATGRGHLGPPRRIVGSVPLATLLHHGTEGGDAQGIVGIVVLRLSPPSVPRTALRVSSNMRAGRA